MSDVVRRLLQGGVDLHCHSGPSPFPRRVDHVQIARHYAASGFRAVVVKSHHHVTAFDVAALGPHGLAGLPVEVCGGVALNGPVGGVNPRAVDLALKMGLAHTPTIIVVTPTRWIQVEDVNELGTAIDIARGR